MNNIKKVAKYVAKNPATNPTVTFLELAVALETGAGFSFSKLYELDRHEFELAMGMIDDWRLDRHYMSKLRLLDHAGTGEAASGK
jgi:hypothetical protein